MRIPPDWTPRNQNNQKLIFLMRLGYIDPDDLVQVEMKFGQDQPLVFYLAARDLTEGAWLDDDDSILYECVRRQFSFDAASGMPRIRAFYSPLP